MTNSISRTEHAVWAAIALIGGVFAAQIDAGAAEPQGSALILMIACYAVCLPGRASPLFTSLAAVAGMVAWTPVITGHWNGGMLVALIPAAIASYGGMLFGRLLDTTASQITIVTDDGARSWFRRALSTRVVLSVALCAIAAVSIAPAVIVLSNLQHPAPVFMALIWAILTLLGWILLAPVLLRDWRRRMLRGAGTSGGVTAIELARHYAIVIALANVHAVALGAICGMLRSPLVPGWRMLAGNASLIYLPFDALAYLTILALGYASDVERRRRSASQREAELRAEALDQRLAAVRARLNPHFLFNSLNSVTVLMRAGRTDESARVVDGLSGLLRYVLDESRAMVPLTDELEFARQYLDVQRVRFGDRLRVAIDADGSVSQALVPQLLLQPIVENAVEHGVAALLEGGAVAIAISRSGSAVSIIVDNDGPSPQSASPGDRVSEDAGIGLASTRERLAHLFGDEGWVTLTPRHEGGARVMIRIPYLEQPRA
jgi:two-component system, LytTR family, sensor kinase